MENQEISYVLISVKTKSVPTLDFTGRDACRALKIKLTNHDLFRDQTGFLALRAKNFLFTVVDDTGVKGVVIGVASCRIVLLRGIIKRGLVFGTIPDVQTVGGCAGINRAMTVDFEVSYDFLAFDLHHSRVLRSARLRGLVAFRRSAASALIFANLGDDFVLRCGNVVFQFADVVHAVAF